MKEIKLKPNKKKRVIIIVFSCLVVVLVVVLIALLYVNGMLGKIHYSPGASSGIVSSEDTTSSKNSPQTDIASLEKQIQDNLKSNSTPLAYDKDVFNVLLIGSDNRADVGGSRSDTMIILSINRKTSRIIMTSLMRDIYLSIPGHSDNRLNAAYAYGGSQLLLQTIQNNFKIKIDKYMSVDFFSFIDIIDKLGGVKITVTDAELPILNSYVTEINLLKGLSPNDGLLLKAGDDLLLTGKQALGYSRIRYVGNADYQRTERQRTVLTKVFTELKGQNIIKQNEILNLLLPDVTTNLSKGELFSLLLSAPAYAKYTLDQDRIPIDGTQHGVVINHMDVLGIDFAKNIAEMQSRIYGKDS
ncbi:MAG: LCP family protein [Clostridia bacterium]|nr:LCP family protein [Clostridia bacterium]